MLSPLRLGWIKRLCFFLLLPAPALLGATPSTPAQAAAEDWIWPGVTNIPAHLRTNLPTPNRTGGYVGSQACRECHQEEHASWHRSYHRTMTQPALPENVVGEFSNRTVDSDGLTYRVYREGNAFMAEMPDPDLMMYIVQGGLKLPIQEVPRVKRPVVMTTGSHHYQTYWVASERYPGILQTLPLVYLPADRRWIPREEAFLRGAGDTNRLVIQWNNHCIRCHATAGNPGLNETTGRLATRVAELGIACEACHGPGEFHISMRRATPADAKPALPRQPDLTIINPTRLDHRRGSEVCGQCHGAYILQSEFAMTFAREGAPYRPGDELFRTRHEVQHPRVDPQPSRVNDYHRNRAFFREQWWDDGTILAGGREFTALSASKCYTRGTLSCTRCHGLHGTDPNDQLKPGKDGSAACTQCHNQPQYVADLSQHTHHLPNSEGSNCLNCHMPHTTYALFAALRSHQIEYPRCDLIARYGTPNACNLCHLDRTLAWTQDALVRWYGQKRVPLTAEQQEVSASALWMLKGNAAQRVIAAWHAGWPSAQAASGINWLAPVLSPLLADPHGVVRYVAAASLRHLPGFESFPYDFLAPPDQLQKQSQAAVEVWRKRGATLDRTVSSVLVNSNGIPDYARIAALLQNRDSRPITIQE